MGACVNGNAIRLLTVSPILVGVASTPLVTIACTRLRVCKLFHSITFKVLASKNSSY